MASIKNLREERKSNARRYRHILDNNRGKLTASEVKELGELSAKIDRLEDSISAAEDSRDTEIEKILAASASGRSAGQHVTSRQLLNRWLKGGDGAITAQEWAFIRNTMSTSTNSEGGYTVAGGIAKGIADAMKFCGSVRQVATTIQTESGGALPYPTSDGTAEIGELVAENIDATDADASFGTAPLPVYKFSSKVVTVPIELLQDSGVNFEEWLNARLATRLARITNQFYTLGTGSGQPTGVVTAASSGKVGLTGQTNFVTFADLVDLEGAVDPAYRVNGAYMMNDSTLKAVKELTDTASRPLWLPALSIDIPQSVCGYPATVNPDVPAMDASAKSILFGDFSRYVVRDVLEIQYFRMDDSAYAKRGKVGFLAYLRSGGNLCDIGGAVKYYQNSAT